MPLLELSVLQILFLIVSVAFLVLHAILLVRMRSSNVGRRSRILNEDRRKSLSDENRDHPQMARRRTEKTESAGREDSTDSSAISKQTAHARCPHHFGYLGKRPKDAPIPSECLTCRRTMECLLGANKRRED